MGDPEYTTKQKRRWRDRAEALRRETYALYLAYRDPRTPWYAKVLAVCVVAYAASPIDLIPDFIPFLGYADDLVIVPLGIALCLKLVPGEVMDECRGRAREELVPGSRVGRVAAVIVVGIWLVALALLALLLVKVL
ncbi:MAG: DUF1232 domain-containing protein [Actinobacteria bacterium]|nr:DUF1232 domain-containing protein [Actinomycetota bacterium]MBU1945303.1 DUF1232 domain-containing protein [Actinomycetota bacterium]MBU2686503.1 DUF1232 domain-containing protein [Actinomycetota bacterium]